MEIKRYSSIYFLVSEMKKDLFGIDANNPTGASRLLSPQLINIYFLPECKKVNINKWKKIN